jgi:hypothetical protein
MRSTGAALLLALSFVMFFADGKHDAATVKG